MSSSSMRWTVAGLVALGLILTACAEPVTSPSNQQPVIPASASANGPVHPTWCDMPPFTCAGATITITPANGRTTINIAVKNIQGTGASWGIQPWSIEKVRFQLPYGTLGSRPADPAKSVLLESGTLGAVAPVVGGPIPWSYTATAKVPITGTTRYRDVVLLQGPPIVGCSAPNWGPTSFYQTCPDSARFTLSVPGAWDWHGITQLWFVGTHHDCAMTAKWGKNGNLAGVVMYPTACKLVAPPPTP